MNTSKICLILLIGVVLITIGSAEINELSPIKVGECKTIPQTCGTCSYVNLSIIYPNSTFAITNVGMNSLGGGAWSYEFCNTSGLGRYDILGSGDLEGTDTAFDVLYFDVSPTGAEDISTGQSNIALISLLVILGVGIFFFYLFTRAEGSAWKVILLGTSGVMIFMSVLYSMVLIDQNLGTFSTLVESYSGFLLVIKILIGLSVLGLLLYALYRAFIMWQIKRGFRDE